MNNKFPFTKTQWQELEHQALIFKYMASGLPIPPDLLFTLRRTYLLDPTTATTTNNFSQHAGGGWNCFQMGVGVGVGVGRKIDPEPGRCRRTDGKKWRCAKEAFPDSKYCERHMHRGKNRSRKPVEVLIKSPTQTTNHTPFSLSSPSPSPSPHHYHYNAKVVDHNPPSFPYLNHHHHTSPDLRCVYSNRVKKEEVDERVFFSQEPCRRPRGSTMMGGGGGGDDDDSWRLTPLTMSCSSSSSKKMTRDDDDEDGDDDDDEHSYLKHPSDHKVGREDQAQTRKTIHFFDEWPVKQKGSWLDLDDKPSNTFVGGGGGGGGSESVSSTQLSISMANNTSYDFPIFKTRNEMPKWYLKWWNFKL